MRSRETLAIKPMSERAKGDSPTGIEPVRERIGKAAREALRDASQIILIAVTKTVEADAIEEALAAGQIDFGENRVQEAQSKWPPLKDRWPRVRLHLIGPLQTNKVREAVRLFDSIHTVDRPKLAAALAAEMEKQERNLELFVQVNTGEEPQKAGVTPAEADAFIDLCRNELRLPIRGLMCLPPIEEEPALHFALLANIAKRNGVPYLSMGMSGDFETAIALGATHIRLGTAIFGERAR